MRSLRPWWVFLLALPLERLSSQDVEPLPPVEYRQAEDFPTAPPSVRRALAERGCRVPVVPSWGQVQGVVSGNYGGDHRRDWAAMCVRDDHEAWVFILWGGSRDRPDSALADPDSVRILVHAPRRYVARFRENAAVDSLPDRLTHDGLEEIRNTGSSIVHYRQGKRWHQLREAE